MSENSETSIFDGCKSKTTTSKLDRSTSKPVACIWQLEGLSNPTNLEILKQEAKTLVKVPNGNSSSCIEFKLGDFKKSLGSWSYNYISLDASLVGNGDGSSNAFDIEVHTLKESFEPSELILLKTSFSFGEPGRCIHVIPELIPINSKSNVISNINKGPTEETFPVPDRVIYGIIVTAIQSNTNIGSDGNFSHPTLSSPLNIGVPKPETDDSLSQNLGHFFSQVEDNYSDLKLESRDGAVLSAHKFLVAARSSVFHELIEREAKHNAFEGTIKIVNVDAKPLMAILHWMYTGELRKGSEKIMEALVTAAGKYKLTGLLKILDQEFIKICTPDNMLRLFQVCKQNEMDVAVQKISAFY